MQLDPQDPNVRIAVFGKQVQDFLDGPIGDYLVKRAQAEIDKGVAALKDCDAEDPKAIRTCQNQIRVAEMIIEWLGDAISYGEGATELLKEEIHAS
jgi:hypothetical protein